MVNLNLRQARPSELSKITSFYINARSRAIGSIPPIAGSDLSVSEWLERRLSSGDEIWLAIIEDEIVGLLMLEPGWIDQLYVRPDLTGQGIGKQLLELAKARMPLGLQLWTFQSNHRAQKFYERHGFIEVERTDGQSNQEQCPDIRYQWLPGSD